MGGSLVLIRVSTYKFCPNLSVLAYVRPQWYPRAFEDALPVFGMYRRSARP
jgi:hypothetical protein